MAQPSSHREQLLHKITSRIRQSLELPEILGTAVDEIRQFLAVDRVNIYRFDADASGQVVAEARQGDRLPSLLHLHFPARDIPSETRHQLLDRPQWVVIDVAAQRKLTYSAEPDRAADILNHYDIRSSLVDPCHVAYLKAMGVQASVILPIVHQQSLWGLLAIHHSQTQHIAESELQIVQLLVDQISIAIAQSELLSQARQRAFQESTLSHISRLLHSPLPVMQSRQIALEAIVETLQASGGRLYLLPEPMDRLAQCYVAGEQPHLPQLEEDPSWQALIGFQGIAAGRINWATAIADWQHRTAHPVIANPLEFTPNRKPQTFTLLDLQQQPALHILATSFAQSKIRSILLVPLEFQGQLLGCLSLFRNGYDQEVQWAGNVQADVRTHRPRDSFEAWLEIRRDQSIPWMAEEQRLAQSISMHLYMAVMQRRVDKLMRYQASHDGLTELPNRLLFAEQLSLELVDAHYRDDMVGVAFLDLDRFKTINDTLGHAMGDELLRQVAERLRHCLRSCDATARWGGDEFTLLLPHLSSAEDISAIAQRILNHLLAPFFLNGQELYITASLGVALAPYDGQDAETLLKHAETAMYQAKQQGKNNFQLYFEESNSRTLDHLILERDLHKALQHKEFQVYYQPQIDLRTHAIVGLEALLRWPHPQRGMVSPAEFIPLAEETGLINALGDWVLHEACRQYQDWRHLGMHPIRLAVNLSAKQFQQTGLINKILAILAQTGMDPHYLEIEITESAVIQNVPFTIALLQQLQNLGIQIAMDDFGTGYSSLNAIKHFPLNTLKIDQCFVREACHDASDAAIARTIVSLGQGLHLKTVAEGVETAEQLAFLKSIGCDGAQGYLFGHPLPAQQVPELLKHILPICSRQAAG